MATSRQSENVAARRSYGKANRSQRPNSHAPTLSRGSMPNNSAPTGSDHPNHSNPNNQPRKNQMIIQVSQDHDGQSYDGFGMTAPEIAQRIERLTAAGHRVTVEIHVDNPNDEPAEEDQ